MTQIQTQKKMQTVSDTMDPNQIALKKLFDSGIPVTQCVFQTAVNNGDDVPEHQFSDKSEAKSRNVQMAYCPPTLMCFHKGVYFGTPIANCVRYRFK